MRFNSVQFSMTFRALVAMIFIMNRDQTDPLRIQIVDKIVGIIKD